MGQNHKKGGEGTNIPIIPARNILDAAVAASHIMDPPSGYQCDATGSMQFLDTITNIGDGVLSTIQNGRSMYSRTSQNLIEGTTLERKKYECAICGSSYATHSGLSRHKRKHLDRPQANEVYPCEQCSKTYQSRQSLLRHIGEQHSNTLYKCQFCR